MELDNRGIEFHSILCPRYDDAVESLDHCLVFCNKAYNIWENIFRWWNDAANRSLSSRELFRNLGNVSVPNGSKMLWKVVVWTAGYYPWNDRNDKVFSVKSNGIEKIVQDIKLMTFEWASRRSRKGSLEWELWMASPRRSKFVPMETS